MALKIVKVLEESSIDRGNGFQFGARLAMDASCCELLFSYV